MKKAIILIVLLTVSISINAQVEYRVNKYRTHFYSAAMKTYIKGTFKEVTTPTTIMVWRNYLNVRGFYDFNLKIAREIEQHAPDGSTFTVWRTTDGSNREVVVIMKDFGTYSRFSFEWVKRKEMFVLETL